MKYQPPTNSPATVENPEPSYFDGNPQAGQKGAIPPAKAIEHPMREILAVIQAAGLTPNEGDLTQLYQAIAIIVGGVGGTPASFALNPIYPEVITNGGVMSIASNNGNVVVATGQQFIHRGGVLYNTTSFTLGQRTLSTVASKTYHLRWRYNGGSPVLALIDVTDGTYNPGALAETDPTFDTTYDDMLIAKVVTDASNNTTTTALKNLARLSGTFYFEKLTGNTQNANKTSIIAASVTSNWARAPIMRSADAVVGATLTSGGGLDGYANLVSYSAVNRYGVAANISTDFLSDVTGIYGKVYFNLLA